MKRVRNISLSMTILAAVLMGCGGGGGSETGIVSSPPASSAGIAAVAWDPVTSNIDNSVCTDLAGYRIYYSLLSPVTKTNSIMVDVGNTTSVEVGGLTSGKTYYFRVSAYDRSGLESDLSNDEAIKIIL